MSEVEVKKNEIGFFTKLFAALIGLASTLSVTLWSGYALLDNRMDSKVETGKKEVYHILGVLKDDHDRKIKAVDDKTSFQLLVMTTTLTEVQKDVKAVLRYSRQAAVTIRQTPKDELHADTHKEVFSDRL